MSHTLRAFAVLLAVSLAAPAPLAQAPSNCLTYPDRLPDPPGPLPYPPGYPRTVPAPPNDGGLVQPPGRSLQPERPTRQARRPAAALREADAECAAEVVERVWTGVEWVEFYRITATYDEAGRLTFEKIVWDYNGDGTVDNVTETTVEYNAQGQILTRAEVTTVGEPFLADNRVTYTYDAEGRLLTETKAFQENSPWQDYSRYVMAYDDGPLPTGYTREEWDGTAWVPTARDSFTFEGERLSQTLSEDWNGTAWVPSNRSTYTYSDGHVTTYLSENYNGADWELDYRSTNTFDAAGRLTFEKSQFWEAGAWVDFSSSAYTYNASGLLAEMVETEEDGGELGPYRRVRFGYVDGVLAEVVEDDYVDGDWAAERRFRYTRDEQGRIAERAQDRWTGSAWVDDRSLMYSYGGAVNTASPPEALSLALSVAPNPVRGHAVLHYTLVAPAAVRLAVYDVLGREVLRLTPGARPAGAHEAAVDLGALAPGAYLVRVEAGAEALTQRITVVR